MAMTLRGLWEAKEAAEERWRAAVYRKPGFHLLSDDERFAIDARVAKLAAEMGIAINAFNDAAAAAP